MMIAKFVLIAVFIHGHGPRVNYANLGDYTSLEACQKAANEVKNQADVVDLIGHRGARFVCAAK